MSNPVLKVISDRRSNRAYKADPVTKEQLDAILTAGVQAPSALNLQSWHFTVVNGRKILAEINTELSKVLNQDVGDVFYAAPTVIFISSDPSGRWGRLDSGIAVQNMALAATSLGLGSVILGMPDSAVNGPRAEYFAKLLKFPKGHAFEIALAVGTALDTKEAHPALPDRIAYAD